MSDPITLTLDLNIRQDQEAFDDLFVQRIREAFEISELGEVVEATIHHHEGTEEPLAATIVMRATSLHEKQRTGLITLIEEFGAPRGSKLHVDSQPSHDLGKLSGFAIYLDGVNLDKKIYKKYDLDDAWDALNHELGDHGMAYGTWHGHSETAIYIYGPDVPAMEAAIKDLLAKHPLFRGARTLVLPDTFPDK